MVNDILDKIDKYLFITLVFIYPLFFLPIFQSPFDTSKLLILTVGVLILSIIKIAKTVLNGNLKYHSSKFDLLIIAFALIYIISSLMSHVSKFDSFVLPGATSFIILASIIYFFTNQFRQKGHSLIENTLIVSTAVASIIQIVSFLGIPGLKILGNNFSTFGSIISSISLFALVLPICLYKILKTEKNTDRILFGLASFVIFIGLSLSFYSILPKNSNAVRLPSLSASWSIAIDTLKQNSLFGVGPTNFLASYNKFRPITANSTIDWNTKYIVSRNTPITIMVEAGLLGLITLLAIFIITLRKFDLNNPSLFSIIAFFTVSLFFPISYVVFPILFLVIALNTESKEVSGIFSSKIPAITMTVPLILLVVFAIFISSKVFYGEYLFGKIINDSKKGDGLKAYEGLNKLILINPYSDRYHIAYAEINIAVANAMAKKEGLSTDDKNTISQLIQQAIKEAKAAATLNSQKSSSWENLGDIYGSIAVFAKGADIFAIQAYNQAIALDPINPLLRIKLGGVYYSQNKFEEAVKVFELAVLAKPDFANSHYNLAMAYKENKQLDKAKEQMNITLSLVGKNSADYETAKKELETIEGLTTPPASPEPAINPKIEIPQ